MCLVTCLVHCFSTWLAAKLTLKVEAMPNIGDEAVAFKMLQHGQQVSALMTVTKSRGYKARNGWKAHIIVAGTRHFGSWRHSITEAVSCQIRKHMSTISNDEIDRIQKVASQIQARRTDTVASRMGSPWAHLENFAAAACSQAPPQTNGVYCVHQIYGIFGDGKPMSPLFQKSSDMWKAVAKNMGAHYQMWNADYLESLIKQKYEQYWDMYVNARYPVMRVDIGRFVILHAYGGLYADCDVMPNRSHYEQVPLAVQRVPEPPRKQKRKRKKNTHFLDMEALVAAQDNPILLKLLDFMVEQTTKTKYMSPSDFYYCKRMRYIWRTTGPIAMHKFFKRRDVAPQLLCMRYLECNHFRHPPKSSSEKRIFDVISTVSNSYFTKDHMIKVPVGRGDARLPLEIHKRRMFGKSAALALRLCPSVAAPGQNSPLATADVDRMPDAVVPPNDHHVSASVWPAGGDNSSGVESRCRCAEYRCAYCISKGEHSPAATRAEQTMHLQASEVDVNGNRANELKAYLEVRRQCASVHVLLDDMPQELRAWVTADWKDRSRSGSSCSTRKKPMLS